MRDHTPILIEDFNGLWKRGDFDSVPLDHFSECNNVSYSQSSFGWRDGIFPYLPISNIVRIYVYNKLTPPSILALDGNGNFWDSDYPAVPILTIPAATDFGFLAWNGRAYISPCNGTTGLPGAKVYVYLGTGIAARPAAGAKPTNADGALAAANSATAGSVEDGIHVFAVVYETNTGFLTAIGPGTLPTVNAPGSKKVDLSSIPVSPNSYVTKVHVIATKAINPTFYTGDTRGYQFFFVPGAIVNNGVTTLSVSFFDSELLADATYLLDMFEIIPAFAGLGTYHNRMVGWAEDANPSVIRVSAPGEPEAFNQVDGLIIFPINADPVTNAIEYRDNLYGFKPTQTAAWSDNGDAPSGWPLTIIDNGLGAGLHLISLVLDKTGANVEFLIIGNYTGIYLFNGAYQDKMLTYKVTDLWLASVVPFFIRMQLVNDTIQKILYLTLNNGTMLTANYSNGLNYKDIRWSPWSFDAFITTIALQTNGNNLILGSNGLR